ncbi:RNA-directed DNA polymerase, eukaryota [Tanacetum coccineum]
MVVGWRWRCVVRGWCRGDGDEGGGGVRWWCWLSGDDGAMMMKMWVVAIVVERRRGGGRGGDRLVGIVMVGWLPWGDDDVVGGRNLARGGRSDAKKWEDVCLREEGEGAIRHGLSSRSDCASAAPAGWRLKFSDILFSSYNANQFQHVDRILRSAKLSSRDDSWTWNLEKSGMFSVASVRKMIDDTLIHSPTLISRWYKYVPIKVNVLVWKALNNSIPTRFNISRRGILIDSIICPTCDVGVETVGHLFFSCSMARDISALIARWWKVPIQNFDCYDDWLEWIESIRMSKESKKMIEAVFYSSWWMIWWFRNSKIFKEKAPKKACLFDELQINDLYDLKDLGTHDSLQEDQSL